MERLGEYLARARKEKGISLEDLASKTRINMQYLKALEEDDFAKVPIEVFAKGFLRAYARTLSLDEKDVLARFEDSSKEFYKKKSMVEWLGEKKRAQIERDAKKNSFVISLIGVGIFLLLIIIMIFNNVGNKRNYQDLEKGIEDVIIPPSSAPVKESGSQISEENVSEEALFEQPKAEEPPKEMLLEIDAVEVTWVSVKIDNTVVKDVLLKPGDRVAWKASDKFLLTLGNAGGVNIKLNGKTLEPLGPRGRVIRDYLLSRG